MYQFALVYIAWKIWNRFYGFFYHWYVRGFLIYSGRVVDFFEKLDRFFSLKITLRHFGEPLYQDRSIVGYIMGFVARSGWILIGLSIYSVIFAVAAIIFIAWCLVPPYLIYKIFT